MFYYNNRGKRIDIVNKRPRNLSAGGMIEDHPSIPKAHKNQDTISSYLEYGSLVVPVPVMKSGVMDGYKGKIKDEKQTDKNELSKTIVMPGELVVHKKYARQVENFLRKKGIKLPLGS